jgi:hypothetical protein
MFTSSCVIIESCRTFRRKSCNHIVTLRNKFSNSNIKCHKLINTEGLSPKIRIEIFEPLKSGNKDVSMESIFYHF